MAAKGLTFDALRASIRARNLKPVYVIHGSEGYFIDALVEEFENLLSEDEREFNLNVLYAPRIDLSTVPSICSRVPMFSDSQVVILKEAQVSPARSLAVLAKYVQNPSPTTVLVIAGRGDILKGELMTAAKKSDKAVVFETPKIYENNMPQFVMSFVKERGLNIEPKAVPMMCEYIGTNLSTLNNEIGKLAEILGPGAMITPEAIEKHVGISHQYNANELIEALAAKDAKRVFRIVNYFRSEPKTVDFSAINGWLFGYFSTLLTTYFARDKSKPALMALVGAKWAVQYTRYERGRNNYNAYQVIEIIRALRAYDCQSKGNGSRRDRFDLFHELMYRILTARGVLFPVF